MVQILSKGAFCCQTWLSVTELRLDILCNLMYPLSVPQFLYPYHEDVSKIFLRAVSVTKS